MSEAVKRRFLFRSWKQRSGRIGLGGLPFSPACQRIYEVPFIFRLTCVKKTGHPYEMPGHTIPPKNSGQRFADLKAYKTTNGDVIVELLCHRSNVFLD